MTRNYHFFWSGPFSNWHKSDFTMFGREFNCVEQAMMYYKAVTFGDLKTADKVMEAEEPRDQKKLGRQVKNFDGPTWDKLSFPCVFSACLSKFSQDPTLRGFIVGTGDDVLVEASPYDRVWGIGYDEKDAFDNVSNWGENRLGQILEKVRVTLR